jgi:GDPmannose 4,6-dehydratase
VGLDWKDHVKTDEALLRPSDIERSVGHPQKARELLNWQARFDLKAIIAGLIASATLNKRPHHPSRNQFKHKAQKS